MSNRGWTSRSSAAPDPLAPYSGRPIVSGPSTTGRYIGRIVVELWEKKSVSGSQRDEVAVSMDPVEAVSGSELVHRIATALPATASTLASQGD